ncbi:hypothetical protein A6V39_00055 [Candidatus Mycoplasma haematobovis]|uniref:Uncharacterized protein n=1 Tax=Candidatus Mycoplasma haematobovis TaxID=432608 RepID=A0A1A9QEK4_9MOLU|nr:hypothetical protein [Candidatus Mycoplasma haematobovis]OAL10441.1 hypothetical protein A6V39_00055 [Candidatus Mycoplasma haematobovis]
MALNLGIKGKIALGAGSLGVIGGGGGILANHILSGDTIRDHLKKTGFTVLEDSATEWTSILTDYIKAVQTNTSLKFEGFNGAVGQEAKLKQFCKELLDNKHKTQETNNNFKKVAWCIKEQTVSDYLGIEGHRVFNVTTTGTNDDNGKWDQKAKDYSKLTDSDGNKKITSLSLSKSNLDTVSDEDRNKVKEACKGLNGKKHFEEEFVHSKNLVINWCSEPKSLKK